MTARYLATREQVRELLADEPKYRADQVFDGLWTQRRPLESLTNVPQSLRTELESALPLALDLTVQQRSTHDVTIKWLWGAREGAQVETVLMGYRDRATVCVSSQAGCAMGCTFCATGQAGFERHLDAGEICEQVLRAQHASEQRVSNVVYMGMGEPLANVDAVLDSLTRLHDDAGFSSRNLTVSTVGVVPGMRRLRDFPLPVTLAVSLHAPDDALRSELVPLNRRYPIAEVLDAARDYAQTKGRRVTFEYACIEDVNDHAYQADALAGRLTGFRGGTHVNLIPLNATAGYRGHAAAGDRIARFAQRLRDRGVQATVRRNRGVDIDAACGQLRSRTGGVPNPTPRSARMAP